MTTTLRDIMTPDFEEQFLASYCDDVPSTPEIDGYYLLTSDAPVHSWKNNQSVHIMDDLYIQQEVLDAILYGDIEEVIKSRCPFVDSISRRPR